MPRTPRKPTVKSKTSAARRKAATPLHDTRFPNENKRYRTARDALLRAEMALRRQTEQVAALRRKLPAGGAIPDDYVFEEREGATVRKVKLSGLFGGKDTLVVYSYMYGPNMERPCPSCTSMLDSLNGAAPHATQRMSLAVVARSPIERIHAFTDARGWKNLRLLSSAGNTYNRDYHAESQEGSQWPVLNVFTRDNGVIRHRYATEMLFAPSDKGQDRRHVDTIWPLWNLFDLTPQGRGADWYPKLSY